MVRTVFPNVSFAVSGGGGLVSQLLPGPTPDRSRTIQSHVFPKLPATDEERARMDRTVEFFTRAVEDEDNWICARIQRGLESRRDEDFVFGKNELGLHRLHDWINHYVSAVPGQAASTAGTPPRAADESHRASAK